MHNVRIVSGRLCSRYVVRGFGFCDLNSPDHFSEAEGDGFHSNECSVTVGVIKKFIITDGRGVP